MLGAMMFSVHDEGHHWIVEVRIMCLYNMYLSIMVTSLVQRAILGGSIEVCLEEISEVALLHRKKPR